MGNKNEYTRWKCVGMVVDASYDDAKMVFQNKGDFHVVREDCDIGKLIIIVLVNASQCGNAGGRLEPYNDIITHFVWIKWLGLITIMIIIYYSIIIHCLAVIKVFFGLCVCYTFRLQFNPIVSFKDLACLTEFNLFDFNPFPSLTSLHTCFNCSCSLRIFASDFNTASLLQLFTLLAFNASQLLRSWANISLSVWIFENSISRRLFCWKILYILIFCHLK